MPRAYLSLLLAAISIAVSVGAHVHVRAQPAGTFNDQGGLAILLFYLPIALGAWLVFGIPALRIGFVAWRDGATAGERWASALGMLLAIVALGLACSVVAADAWART